ncbi:hypothetical protein DIPPA_54333 [Diplonema papillatum]|nr:hypothetical protein DIPPA_54333 [Diplonema papillatum]
MNAAAGLLSSRSLLSPLDKRPKTFSQPRATATSQLPQRVEEGKQIHNEAGPPQLVDETSRGALEGSNVGEPVRSCKHSVPRLVVSPLTGGVPRLRPGVDRVLLPRLQLVSGSRLFSIFGIKSGQRFCSRRIGGTLPSREAFAGKELTRLPLFTEPCIHGLQL